MVLRLLNTYFKWFIISICTCAIGVAVSFLYSKQMAHDFIASYIWYFDGLLIPTTGFGTLHFAIKTCKGVYHNLITNIFSIPLEYQHEIYKLLDDLNSFRSKQKIAIPIFIVGGGILYCCGYPLNGVPQFILWLTTSSLYYAGGLMVAYLYYTILLFKRLEVLHNEIILQKNTQLLELETFNFYQSLLFLSGMIALYFAFRGTLTANFTYVPPGIISNVLDTFASKPVDYSGIKLFLLYPLILFLPYALFGGFYIKYVLRKIYLSSIKNKLSEIDQLSDSFTKITDQSASENEIDRVIKLRTAVLELKSKIIQDNKVLPLVNIKDSPSFILLIIIVVQFIYQNDKTISGFIRSVLGI